ncbi:hypothetical protein MTF65_10165 [Streptomyces sp. APSN-46.1]|uniref:hypothetical protein n=1 Tax=Streptomyces sp. APSN-46.1 TaxID=2929049 RepID=UPI001FB4EC96|nr:hypothetical protein [Streptomyces sp. APSN-46.1]MCJ1677697.1 hypothetical protein [Streptomyces sp. APSN-46.1]
MNEEISPHSWAPDWVPDSGFQLRLAGVHFDALRIQGQLGEETAKQLCRLAGYDPGPIVYELNGFRWMYFLLPPGTVRERSWPSYAQRYSSRTRPAVAAYVGVPALSGCTWPLAWRSLPTRERPYVDPDQLEKAIGD